jgi:hypothetical protein
LKPAILSPGLGDIVDSGIGFTYRPASLCNLAGPYNYPMPESTLSPSQGLRILSARTSVCSITTPEGGGNNVLSEDIPYDVQVDVCLVGSWSFSCLHLLNFMQLRKIVLKG